MKILLRRLLVGATLLAATALTLVTVAVVRFERSVEARIEHLTRQGTLRPIPHEWPPEVAWVHDEFGHLTRRLEVDVGFDVDIPKEPPPLTPYDWKPERAELLEERVAAAQPVIVELATLLRSDEAVAMKAGNAIALDWESAHPLRHILWIRNWSNVLCATAVQRARAGRIEESAQSLALALDLGELTDNETYIGLVLWSINREAVQRAVDRILEDEPRAAASLQKAIAPHLTGVEVAIAERAFTYEVSAFVEHTRVHSTNALTAWPWERAPILGEIDRGLDQLEAYEFRPTLERRRAGTVERWAGSRQAHVDLLADRQRVTTFWRVKLALAAHRQRVGAWPVTLGELVPVLGELPVDPLTGEPLHYESGGGSVTLAYADVLRSNYQGHLRRWSWRPSPQRD